MKFIYLLLISLIVVLPPVFAADRSTDAAAASTVKWENKKQKAHCESLLAKIRKNFLDARHYSIQGDSCATARYAKAFLTQAEACGQECPEGFLKESGYDDQVMRNLSWLQELGIKRCIEQ